jgi:hypothetical protein
MARGRIIALTLAVAAIGALGACASSEQGTDDWEDTCDDGKCDGESAAVAPLSAPDLLVNDLGVLRDLEHAGFDLANVLHGATGNNTMLAASSPVYAAIADTIGTDIAEILRTDPAAGVGLGASHRVFDVRWLRAASARFRLVAVANRTDAMASTPGSCGEVRFVYRLEYTSPKGTSRLPMTLMAVYDQAMVAGGCSAVARSWQGNTYTADKLRAGPLASLGAAARVEINLQSVRWPAGVRADLGGHAEYVLRVFTLAGTTATPLALPNTIKPSLSLTQAAALRTWITSNLAAIDAGTARVPAEYLATKAISVSPRGLARGANRPFLQAFPNPEQAFTGVSFAGLTLVKSPAGLVRRLDTMSCQGCHQSRGLAGFHILGQEDPDAPRANVIEVGTSPHLHEDLRFRKLALASIASGATTTPRPFAERNASIPGLYGAHCGLGDASFASWTCADGLTCTDVNGDEVGMCMPGKHSAGDACETSSVTFEADPHRDTVFDMSVDTCTVPSGASAKCSRSTASGSLGGFPNGSCTAPCPRMGAVGGPAICGAMPPSGFNECLASGKLFTDCLAKSSPTFRRRCDSANPCGDDYVCAGVANAPKGVGACMPPYFIFQARVDGHTVP